MESSRIVGENWGRTRLLFDDIASAQPDNASLVITEVNDDGVFKGRFENSTDMLVEGRFMQDGLRPRIVFTRRNEAGNVTTRYVGRVIEVAGATTVLIRGRFTRATTNGDGAITISSGDHETEKPT